MTEKKEKEGNESCRKLVQSDSWFPGSVCHVRYAGGVPEYIYFNVDDPERALRKEVRRKGWMAAVAVIAFICFVISALGERGVFPEKLVPTEDLSVLIDDPYGYLSTEPSGLYDRLVLFEQRTGIVPVVKVREFPVAYEFLAFLDHGSGTQKRLRINIDSFSYGSNSSLWWYTYGEYYVRLDNDGRRMLIMMYVPEKSDDWCWIGMYNGIVRTAVSDRLLDRFADTLQNKLQGDENAASALTKAFDEILPDCGRTDVQTLAVIILRLIASGGAATMLITGCVKLWRRLRSLGDLTRLPDNVGNDYMTCACSQCGGIFVAGVHKRCPHCGAAVKLLQVGD